MEMKRWKTVLIMALALAFMTGFPFSALAGEASLGIVKGSGDSLNVEMGNDIPVLGVEFTLTGLPDVTTVKKIKTTWRSRRFMAQFNDLGEKGLKIILVSLRGDSIPPGDGPIARIICQDLGSGNINLEMRDVNVADINNQPIKTSALVSNF